MTSYKSFVLGIFISLSTLGFCQNSILINQAPLLYNPSFAGGMNGARISAFERYETITDIPNPQGSKFANTNLLSYDNLDKKSGIGYGGFAYYENSNVKVNNNFSIQGTLGPKYQIKDKNDKVKFTFSPNVFVGYTFSSGYNGNSTLNYSNGILGGGPESFVSNDLSYTTANGYQNKLETGLSFLLNNDKGFIGLTVSNNLVTVPIVDKVYNYSNPKDTVYSYSSVFQNPGTYTGIAYKSKDSTQSSHTTSASFLSVGIQLGRTFKFKKDSKFSITPSAAINFAIQYSNNENYTWIQRVNTNLTFAYSKVFIGIGLSSNSTEFNDIAFYIGYQNQRFRIAPAFYCMYYSYPAGYSFAGSSGNYITADLSFSLFLP